MDDNKPPSILGEKTTVATGSVGWPWKLVTIQETTEHQDKPPSWLTNVRHHIHSSPGSEAYEWVWSGNDFIDIVSLACVPRLPVSHVSWKDLIRSCSQTDTTN